MYGFPRTPVARPTSRSQRVSYDLAGMSGCVFWLRADHGVTANTSTQITAVTDRSRAQLAVNVVGTLLLPSNAAGTMPLINTGSGNNYLTITHSSAITFGTGDFTILTVASFTNTGAGMTKYAATVAKETRASLIRCFIVIFLNSRQIKNTASGGDNR